MTNVDSFRFVDLGTRQVMRAWIAREPRREPVWTPLAKPLRESRLLAGAGVTVLLPVRGTGREADGSSGAVNRGVQPLWL